jgi:hypothetical protein
VVAVARTSVVVVVVVVCELARSWSLRVPRSTWLSELEELVPLADRTNVRVPRFGRPTEVTRPFPASLPLAAVAVATGITAQGFQADPVAVEAITMQVLETPPQRHPHREKTAVRVADISEVLMWAAVAVAQGLPVAPALQAEVETEAPERNLQSRELPRATAAEVAVEFMIRDSQQGRVVAVAVVRARMAPV